MSVEAYPLAWPQGQPRTNQPTESRFGKRNSRGWLVPRSNYESRCFLEDEVDRLGGRGLVISTDVPLRKDGNGFLKVREPDDSGVAVYFERKKQPICIACDTYLHVWENLYAVGRTIEGFRRMERDGIPGFLDKAFTGFTAIEDKTSRSWRQVLGLDVGGPVTIADAKRSYRALLIPAHPDHGGSASKVQELQDALAAAERELLQ
jgi:hypothetical protein